MVADTVSLAWELEEIRHAIGGARVLCDLVAHGRADSDRDLEAAPRSASAILSVVACRLRLLRLAATGELDPDLVRAPHNAIELQQAKHNESILYWDAKRRVRFARRERKPLTGSVMAKA